MTGRPALRPDQRKAALKPTSLARSGVFSRTAASAMELRASMPSCGPAASASPASGAHKGKRHSAAPAQETAAEHSRHGYGIAPNLLQRAFEADRPNTI